MHDLVALHNLHEAIVQLKAEPRKQVLLTYDHYLPVAHTKHIVSVHLLQNG